MFLLGRVTSLPQSIDKINQGHSPQSSLKKMATYGVLRRLIYLYTTINCLDFILPCRDRDLCLFKLWRVDDLISVLMMNI